MVPSQDSVGSCFLVSVHFAFPLPPPYLSTPALGKRWYYLLCGLDLEGCLGSTSASPPFPLSNPKGKPLMD